MSEIQESYNLLLQVDKLLADIQLKITRIQSQAPTVNKNLANFKQLERLALRWLVLANRMGLPEDVSNSISKISQLIVTVRMLTIAMSLLEASNPVTFAFGVAGLATAGFSIYDTVRGF